MGDSTPVDQGLHRQGEGGDGRGGLANGIGVAGYAPDPRPGVEEGAHGGEWSKPGRAEGEEGGRGEDPEEGKGAAHREWWGERGVWATAEHCKGRELPVQLVARTDRPRGRSNVSFWYVKPTLASTVKDLYSWDTHKRTTELDREGQHKHDNSK